MDNGYILLHRKVMSDWEWYNNVNDTRVWIHCLLKANWKKGYFDGKEIGRGSFVTSYEKLASETNLTFSQVRKSIEHLKKSNNLTITRCSKYSIISIVNYEKYQLEKQSNSNQMTFISQSNNNQITTIEKRKEYIVSMYVSNNKRACARVLNSIELDLIDSWFEDYDFEMIKRAVEIALLKNKDLLSYPDGILRNWKSKGYLCIEDVYENEGKVEVEENKEPVEIFNCDWLNMEEIE